MEPFTSKVSKNFFTKEKGSLFNMKVWMKLLMKKKGPYPFLDMSLEELENCNP